MSKTVSSPSAAAASPGSDQCAQAESTADTQPPIIDVWSRSGSRYRIRAIVLLAVNVLLFAGVGTFAYWLRRGQVFAPRLEDYWVQMSRAMGFAGGESLTTMLVAPISVQDVPMQIAVLGLLMAALVSIPILVAILYRFWSSLPFIAVVGILAVMPWLAITLLASCVLAAVRPFRTSLRFMSALLGLVPVVVYLVMASVGTTELVAVEIDPVDRIKFVAPWVLAVVAASVVFAIVLLIAKMVDYRPGAITPLLAVMFGLPVALFEQNVGRDELYYRLLEARANRYFEPVNAARPLKEAARRAWERSPVPGKSLRAAKELEEQKWQLALLGNLRPWETELTRHQDDLANHCDWFVGHFPDSRYALNALFLKARAFDIRVDTVEFRRSEWIRFYDDFPSEASAETWRKILQNRPDSIVAAVALLRLAQLDARCGDVERAIDKLAALLARFDSRRASLSVTAGGPSAGKGVLERAVPEAGLGIEPDRTLLEAHRLHDLLVSNADPLYGFDPIGRRRRQNAFRFGLMDLQPRQERYIEDLIALRAHYPRCQLQDNIDLEIAKATPDLSLRIERLERCLETFPKGDAAPEALFRLGVACRAGERADRSREAFERLARDHARTIWANQAARLLPSGRLAGTTP